jgi:transcriptional regulator with XRE-family HTH domain
LSFWAGRIGCIAETHWHHRGPKLRDEQGFSHESFADHCGLHRTYISGIDRGVRNPTVVIIDKVARALRVPASQLLEELRANPLITGRNPAYANLASV